MWRGRRSPWSPVHGCAFLNGRQTDAVELKFGYRKTKKHTDGVEKQTGDDKISSVRSKVLNTTANKKLGRNEKWSSDRKKETRMQSIRLEKCRELIICKLLGAPAHLTDRLHEFVFLQSI